jgi:DNA-binding NtrC family response regulator
VAEDRVVERSKVLVVDYDHGVYEVLTPELSKHGYEIHTTTAISKALALAGAHRYQAAFLCLTLVRDTPLLSGLMAEHPGLPVIIVLPPDSVDCLPPQVLEVATYVIGKPLKLESVRLMLDRTLELVALRELVQRHRQAWCDMLSPRSLSETADDSEAVPAKPLEVALSSKLRYLIPNLEVLGRGSLHRVVLSYVEKLLLTTVLNECRGNQVRSAEILGINRNTLRKKIRDFGLSYPRGRA